MDVYQKVALFDCNGNKIDEACLPHTCKELPCHVHYRGMSFELKEGKYTHCKGVGLINPKLLSDKTSFPDSEIKPLKGCEDHCEKATATTKKPTQPAEPKKPMHVGPPPSKTGDTA